jgi:hypothetical protein
VWHPETADDPRWTCHSQPSIEMVARHAEQSADPSCHDALMKVDD